MSVELLLSLIAERYPLREHHAGKYTAIAVGPMTFTVTAYEAQGLGNVAVMTGAAPQGGMKMDTLVINPFERDMVLFSYDRIYAMGSDTLLLELCDTRLDRKPIDGVLAAIVAQYADIPNEPVKPNWYDDIRLADSVAKKGSAALTPRFDTLTADYVRAYLNLCAGANPCDRAEKIKAAAAYTEGLLSAGGPSTDCFMQMKGREFTEKMFRDVFFATGNGKV